MRTMAVKTNVYEPIHNATINVVVTPSEVINKVCAMLNKAQPDAKTSHAAHFSFNLFIVTK
jgi:hypothetical protein